MEETRLLIWQTIDQQEVPALFNRHIARTIRSSLKYTACSPLVNRNFSTVGFFIYYRNRPMTSGFQIKRLIFSKKDDDNATT